MRQHAVEHDHVEAIGGRPLEPLATVPRDSRLVPARGEPRRDEVGGLLVVFDNQKFHSVALAERQDVAIRGGRAPLPAPVQFEGLRVCGD